MFLESSKSLFPTLTKLFYFQNKQPKTTRPNSAVCTFRPEINPNTDAILAGTPLQGCDFLSRQQQLFDNAEQRKVNFNTIVFIQLRICIKHNRVILFAQYDFWPGFGYFAYNTFHVW